MRSLQTRKTGLVPALAALTVLVVLLTAFTTAQAREKRWYIGGGFASTEVSGDLNAATVFTQDPVNGPFVFGVDFEEGDGFSFQAGVAVSRYIAFETQLDVTGHDVTNNLVFPGETHKAAVASTILAVRGMLPLGDSFEVFARLGFGAYVLGIQQNVTTPTTTFRTDSTFSGNGTASGLGIAFNLGRIGIELASTTHEAGFDTLDDGRGTSGTIPNQDMTFKTANLIITAHFGGKL